MTDRKLDIFEVLKHINAKDYLWFDSLSEEEQKAFVPLVTARWLSGTKNPGQVVNINEMVNRYTFAFGTAHKGLLYRLLCGCPSGKPQPRYQWLKTPKPNPKRPESVKTIQKYLNCSSASAKQSLELLDVDDVLSMASELGLTKEEIKKIQQEFK